MTRADEQARRAWISGITERAGHNGARTLAAMRELPTLLGPAPQLVVADVCAGLVTGLWKRLVDKNAYVLAVTLRILYLSSSRAESHDLTELRTTGACQAP